jgi:hypothetical protein
VPSRSRDVSEVIRLHTLCEVDRLMRQDPDMYLENKWTARVFLMVHDPVVEVRLKAVQVISSWYSNNGKRSTKVQEHLVNFAEKSLAHLMERVADTDARVAAAAIRCLRLPQLAERLKDEEFDTLVNLCIGSRETLIREEAALFINSHVFQDPGICTLPAVRKAVGERRGDEDGDDAAEGRSGDVVKTLFNAETAMSMMVEYLENYMGDKLRLSERVIGAFWPRAPALTNWATMVNFCLIGETSGRPGVQPVTSRQRLALLYIMEAAVRRADDEVKTAKPSEKELAMHRMNEACSQILAEMPRLLDVCRPEEQQSLLLAHVCKILVEYAVEHSQNQVLVNAKALCQSLRKVIEGSSPLDTIKYCADSLLGLSRAFQEAKSTFLSLAKAVNKSCTDLLAPEAHQSSLEALRPVLSRFMMLSNRGIDMSFGNIAVFNSFVNLLRTRADWSKRLKELEVEADSEVAPTALDEDASDAEKAPGETARGQERDSKRRRIEEAPPDNIPDVRLTLLLLEAATTSVMWHVRMAYWLESHGKEAGAEAQVVEQLQGFGELTILRAELPTAASKLRQVCSELVIADVSPHVRFHAYSAYMTLIQLAIGVSDKLSLEESAAGAAAPTGWGATFEVNVSKNHMEVLWRYLNSFYSRLSDVDGEGVNFNAEGHRVEVNSVNPSPSQGTLTSVRYLTQQLMDISGRSEAMSLEPREELLLAVVASRQVAEAELEDIYTGPLGLLLLTQCEKARPKPLREVAFSLLRRLREQARMAEAYAVQYYACQQEAVESLYVCSGIEAALSLSNSFVKQWGIRGLPWLERALYVVLKQAIVECITEDSSRLPLLEAYIIWLKADFVQERYCKDIAAIVLERCTTFGISSECDVHIQRVLRKLLPATPIRDGGEEAGEVQGLEVVEEKHTRMKDAAEVHPENTIVSPVTHRISGKRPQPVSIPSVVESAVSPSPALESSTSRRKRSKTSE